MLRAAGADAAESELSNEAAKQVSPVGPVNERGEPLNTPVHGMPAKPVVGDAAARGGPVNERGEPLSTPVVRTDTRVPAAVPQPELMPDEPAAGAGIVDVVDESLPLPEIGEPVRYFAGPMAFRGRRNSFPAIVFDVDKRRRTLDLIVFYDAQEFVDQTGVLERRGGERGFERIVPPGLLGRWMELMVGGSVIGEAPPMRVVGGGTETAAEEVEQPVAAPLDEATLSLVNEIVAKRCEERFAELTVRLVGAFEVPEGGLGTALNDHDERIEALEKAGRKKPRKAKAPKK